MRIGTIRNELTNSTRTKEKALVLLEIPRLFSWLRGKDLNQRPSGYEPDELPTAPPRDISLVPLTGLEPVRYFYRRILSPLCLPIPPQRQVSSDAHSLECHNRIPHIVIFVNIFFKKEVRNAVIFCRGFSTKRKVFSLYKKKSQNCLTLPVSRSIMQEENTLILYVKR